VDVTKRRTTVLETSLEDYLSSGILEVRTRFRRDEFSEDCEQRPADFVAKK
jgi:hypothetical protein